MLVLLSLTAALVLIAAAAARRREHPRATLRRMLRIGALFGAAWLALAYVTDLP